MLHATALAPSTRRTITMGDLIEITLSRLAQQLCGRLSIPGDERFAAATAIWAKRAGQMQRAVPHCRTPQDVQSAIRSAREADLSLSVRGGGHNWAGRALCNGIVIDLSGMNGVIIGPGNLTAKISGGSGAADVLAATDPIGLAALAWVTSWGAAGYLSVLSDSSQRHPCWEGSLTRPNGCSSLKRHKASPPRLQHHRRLRF
jgi:FAD binding domain-containing protein